MSKGRAIIDIGQPFGKEGLRFLVLFKTIKLAIVQQVQKEKEKQLSDVILNKICAEVTRELLIESEGTPSEAQIGEVVQRLKEELKRREF